MTSTHLQTRSILLLLICAAFLSAMPGARADGATAPNQSDDGSATGNATVDNSTADNSTTNNSGAPGTESPAGGDGAQLSICLPGGAACFDACASQHYNHQIQVNQDAQTHAITVDVYVPTGVVGPGYVGYGEQIDPSCSLPAI